MPPISKRTKLQLALAPTAAGTSDTSHASNPIDMTGFDGARFIITCGLTTGAGYGFTAQASSTTTVGDFAAFSTSITAASTVNNRIITLDVYRPTKRYVRVVSTTTTASDLSGVIVELYQSISMPTTNASTDVVAESFGIST